MYIQYILIIISSLIAGKKPIGIKNLYNVCSEKEGALSLGSWIEEFLIPICPPPAAQCLLWLWEVKKGEDSQFDGCQSVPSAGPLVVSVSFGDLALVP